MADRSAVLAPLSRPDAERLLPRLNSVRPDLEERILRARCLRAIEAFDVAWNELLPLREKVKDRLLRARVEQDLLHLSYYVRPSSGGGSRADADARGTTGSQSEPVGHELDLRQLYESGMRDAGGDALLVAELDTAWSVHRLVSNDAQGALRAAQAAEDALRAAPQSRERELVLARLQRQLAHVLALAAEYPQARAAADASLASARRLRDPWETAWSTYATGFAAWCAGAVEDADSSLVRAEELLRPYGTSAWRWTVYCLARVRLEQGAIEEGDRLARQSGAGVASERAFIALARRDIGVAAQLVGAAPPDERPFSTAVEGMVVSRRGEPRTAVRLLEEARTAFAADGLQHYALGAAAHLAFARENLAYGGGRERGVRVVRELADRGGSGFAWFLPEVAEWLGKLAISDPRAAPLAKALRARGETARARARRASPSEPSEVDGATAHLRMAGLTWRELDIVRRLSLLAQEGERLDRDTLAERLGMSPNTLRVHLTRIRAKLDVGDKRGDEAILEAVKRLPATV